MADVQDDRRGGLGRYVRELRLERGLSQVQLADATGGAVTDSHIAAVELGRRGLGEGRAKAIATALSATTEQEKQLLSLAGHNVDGQTSVADQMAELRSEFNALRRRVEELADAVQARGLTGKPRGGAKYGRGK